MLAIALDSAAKYAGSGFGFLLHALRSGSVVPSYSVVPVVPAVRFNSSLALLPTTAYELMRIQDYGNTTSMQNNGFSRATVWQFRMQSM